MALIAPASPSRPLPWPPEEQNIAVRIANLEAAKTVARILQGHAEGRSITRKFGGQPIWVFHVNERIQPQVAMAPGVRHRLYAPLGLDEDLRSVAADDGEKRILLRLLESRLKTKLVAVKSDGLIDVADDEAR